MESDEGKVCDRCRLTFQPEPGFTIKLYQSYRDFIASEKSGCFICFLLWAMHQPPDQIKQGIEDVNNDYEFGKFSISAYTDHNHNAIFDIQSSWASTLIVEFVTEPLVQPKNIKTLSCALLSDLEAHPWSTLGPSIGSDESLGKIRQWISSCQANHKSCGSTHKYHRSSGLDTSTFFPTRVIDVEKADDGMICLRDRAEVMVQFGADNEARLPTSTEPDTMHNTVHKYPVYWTLSHRWGNTDEMPRLLKDTEAQLRKGVRLDELPPINRTWPAFHDAALLVKRLGYRYIWIDSLCIFQDSESEWQREASTMIDIYRYSHCNISAGFASSDPANIGLFRRRKFRERLYYPLAANIDGRLWWAWDILRWGDEVEKMPLNKRGWVVQERFLATRTVYFSEDQIFWGCRKGTNCEVKSIFENLEDPEYLDYLERGRTKYSDTKSNKAGLLFHELEKNTTGLYPPPHDKERSETLCEHWTQIVEYYTKCGLTKESDRLVAVSGIAKAFQEATGDTYMAGLWKGNLSYWLTWATEPSTPQVRRSKYAPSWSWASITGSNVEFAELNIGCDVLNHIKLIEERIVPELPNGESFGLLRSAELDIECMLCYLVLECADLEDNIWYNWVYYDEARSQCFSESDSRTYILYDTSDLEYEVYRQAHKEMGRFVYTLIPVWGKRDWIFCLILKRDIDNRFQRIGRLELETNFLDEWDGQKSRITLI